MSPFIRRAAGKLPIALALVGAAILVWYFGFIAPAKTPVGLWGASDFYNQILPMAYRAAESLRSGELPLWNPYQYAGHPFLATGLYGVLYPPNALYLVLPTPVAIEAVVILHFILAGLFTYAYARAVLHRADAAFVAATTFMLSGFLTLEAGWFSPALSSAVWLPLALLAIERICGRPSLSWIAVLGAALALSFHGGWAQTWLYTSWVVAVYAFARLITIAIARRSVRAILPIGARIAAAGALALLLMASQLLPTLELQGEGGRRVGGLSVAQQLIAPPIPFSTLVEQALDSETGWPRMAYLGMATFVLLPLSFATRGGRWRLVVFWGLALVALSVTASADTPLFELYRKLGGAWFRGPRRIMYIYAFVGAMLAGLGFAIVARAAADGARRALVLTVPVVVAAGSFAFVMPDRSRVYLCVVAALIVAGVLLPRPALRRAAIVALAAFITFDLSSAVSNEFLRPYHDMSPLDRNAAAFDYIRKSQNGYRTLIKAPLFVTELAAKQGTLRGIYSITDYEPLSLERFDRFFHAVEPPAMHRASYVTFVGSLRSDPASPTFGLLDIMSLRYVILPKSSHEQMARAHGQWRRVFFPKDGEGDLVVYAKLRPLPRAYVTPQWKAVYSEDAALAALTDGFDPYHDTIIEPDDGGAIDPTREIPNARLTAAEIVEYEPRRVVIRSNAQQPGYLVLTDTFYPGWRATLDGREVPMVRANYLFRAVRVTAGPHELTYTYEPWSFRLGAGLGLIGLAAIVGLVGADRIRARRLADSAAM